MTDPAVAPATYDLFADYYDITAPDRSPEIDFYAGLLAPSTASLLDLGCGTGALTVPLARRIRLCHASARIVGIDQSARMLDIARGREPAIEWLQGDIRVLPVDGRFDFAICGFNTLQLLLTDDDLLMALRSVRQLLAPDGRFAFDIYQPNPAYLQGSFAEQTVRAFCADGKPLEVRQAGGYDPVSRVLTLDWRLVARDEPDAPPLGSLCSRLRQHFSDDVERLLAASGLRIVERFGFYDRSPFTAGSKKQLVVCTHA